MEGAETLQAYHWTQTLTTVTVLIQTPTGSTPESSNVVVNLKEGKLEVKLFDNTIIDGKLQGTILKDQGVWLLQEKRLIVHIRKRAKKMWDGLLTENALAATTGINGALSDAQFFLGMSYEDGQNSLKKDYEVSLECYCSAAELGNLIAQLRVAFIYMSAGTPINKFPVTQNPEEAFKYHVMAAQQHNHVEALYNVGNDYYQGMGVVRDHKKAIEYYKKATEFVPPLVEQQGRLVPPANLDKNAEAQQSLLAMFHLGLIYTQGEDGVERDPEEAFRWWRKAARYQHPQSMYNMGVMLLSNEQVSPPDAILAYIYIKEANKIDSDLPIPEALKFLEEQLEKAAQEQKMPVDELLLKMRLEVEELEMQAEKEQMAAQAPANKIAISGQGEEAEEEETVLVEEPKQATEERLTTAVSVEHAVEKSEPAAAEEEEEEEEAEQEEEEEEEEETPQAAEQAAGGLGLGLGLGVAAIAVGAFVYFRYVRKH